MKKYLTSLISMFVFAAASGETIYSGTDNKISSFDDDIVYVNSGAVVEPLGTEIAINYP